MLWCWDDSSASYSLPERITRETLGPCCSSSSSGTGSRYAATLTETPRAGPQKGKEKGGFLEVYAWALQSGMVHRCLSLPLKRYRLLRLIPCGSALLQPQLQPQPQWLRCPAEGCSHLLQRHGFQETLPLAATMAWQDFIQSFVLSFPASCFSALRGLELNVFSFVLGLVQKQLSFRSCCRCTIAMHGEQEIMVYCLKQQSKTPCSEKKKKRKIGWGGT